MYQFDQCFLYIILLYTIKDTYQGNLLPHQPFQEVYNSTILPVLEPYEVSQIVSKVWQTEQK